MKRKVAVLGATGLVGQRLVSLLQNHPWFKVEILGASERSMGQRYGNMCRWVLERDLASEISEMIVVGCDLESLEKSGSVDLVFSCLPSEAARGLEEKIAAEYAVFSKSSTHRLEQDVPLMIPEVNPDHLGLINIQRKLRNWKGFLSTDPNCSTIQLALSLKPLASYGISRVLVSTMQAISGAGYPGVASLDITGNVIPFIANEEEKIENETLKVLGEFDGQKINYAPMEISASCHRVDVRDGHTESVFVELERKPEISEIKKAFSQFQGQPQLLRLPSAPKRPIVIVDKQDRPQPIYDANVENGMSIVIGRIRPDKALTFKYVCLGHNTIRGAAGATLLSAELAVAKGFA